jgi:hypothetical protein
MNDAVQQRDAAKKKADDAGNNAGTADTNRNDVKGRPDGIDDANYYKDQIQAEIDAEVSKRGGAEAVAAGKTAARANDGRNKSNMDAERAKTDRLEHDSKRNAENANAAKHKADADDARARKLVEDDNLENIKKKTQNDADKMDGDAAGAVSGRKKDLDDANGAAKKQDDSANNASKKRDDMEKAVGENGDAVNSKKKEVSDAQSNELAAKNKMDADAAAKKKQQDDLDGLTAQEPNLKKGRDDAGADADAARPKRSDEDTAKKNAQSKLDGEAGDLTKTRDDAQSAKDAAVDGAARTKAKQDGLPHADDTGPLRDKDAELQKKKKDEEDNRDDLEEESDKHKQKLQESGIRLQLKQQVVSSQSAVIAEIIRIKYGDKFLPPPPGPLMTGYFKYPVGPSGSVTSTTTSGPKPAGFIDPGTGVATLVSEIDLGTMGEIKYTDPSYERGRVVGAQDGARDATSDATDAFLNKKNETIKDLESRIGQLDYATKREIDTAIAAQSQDAYCKQIKEEGAAQRLDISSIFSECSAYFQKHNPLASQPMASQPMASRPMASRPMAQPLEQLGGPIGSESSGANEESSGAQEGGYSEDLSGVMQFGGVLTNSGPVVPTEHNDVEYMNGYRAGYKKAYTQTYSLTMAIKITQKVSKENSNKKLPKEGENEYGAKIEEIIRESMPLTEAVVIKRTKNTKSKGKTSGEEPKTTVEGPKTTAEGPKTTAEGPKTTTNRPKNITTEAEASAMTNSSTNATGPNAEAATGPITEAATGPLPEATTGPTAEVVANRNNRGTKNTKGVNAAPIVNRTTVNPTVRATEPVKSVITGPAANPSAPSTEAPVNTTELTTEAAVNATGPLTEAAANATGPVTEYGSADSANVTGPTQGGGFLNRALRNFQRGRTLKQHERLLKRIADKTNAA